MAEMKNVPAIRFKGFNSIWNVSKLEDFGIATGGTSIESEFSDNGKYKVISIGSYSENSTYTDQGIRAIESEKTIGRVLNKNDLAMVLNDKTLSGRIIGRVLQIENDDTYVYNQRTQRIEPIKDKYDSVFLYQLLNAPFIRKKIIRSSQGNTQIYVNWSKIKDLIYLVPVLQEQTQIGSYFQHLDKLIRLHQAKVNKLTNLKKAMLEKMFPKPGADVPEIRFKGFAGAWEKREINTLADRHDNLRIPITAANRTPGPVPYYGANGIQDYVDGYTHEGEFILIAEDGANDLKNYPVQYVNGKIWVNNHAHVLQGKNMIACNLFLKYAFSQVNIEPFLVGGGRAKLNAETMMKIEMPVPESIDEQEKIGTYFQNLDKTIALHQTELEKLNHLKKACLEKMFV